MSTKVIVDTTDAGAADPTENIEVVSEGNKLVTIDTLRDDMDEIIKEPVRCKPQRTPSPPNPPPPKRVATPPSPKKKPVAVAPPQNQKSPTARKMLDGQSAFQDALKETVPGSTSDDVATEEEPTVDDEDIEEPETTELPAGLQQSEEEPEPEEEEEIEEETEAPAEEEEDEDVVKLRLLDEINGLMADGYLPPQQPSFSMDITTLLKIKEYQEASASEAFGIQLIGWGWINLIGIVENVNQKFDPAAKIFGPGKGLKLDGAAEKVSKNIRRYRAPFKYIWKKMASKKLEEYSPLITMALVTLDILKSVHVENVRKEMRESAAAELHRPGAFEDAIKLATPAPIVQPPEVPTYSEQLDQKAPAVESQQPVMRPVDDIEIPVSDDEPPVAAAAEDDEIEVEVPKGKGRKSRRRQSQDDDFE